jgi:hypothetical protein
MTTSPKLVLFNGPRHSGKDTAALHVAEKFNAYHFKFSGPIKAAIRAAFDLCDEEVDFLESIKTEPTSLLLGKSYVEVQISFSETWAKHFFGEDVFGKLATRKVRNAMKLRPDTNLFVCSDSGFVVEAWPVIENLFGTENTALVRIQREGKTFAGDSRSYIELPGVTQLYVDNSGTVEEYYERVDNLVLSWLNNESPF